MNLGTKCGARPAALARHGLTHAGDANVISGCYRAFAAAHERHRRQCLQLLNGAFARPALHHALVCQQLQPGVQADRLVAICRLVAGEWAEALAATREAEWASHDSSH